MGSADRQIGGSADQRRSTVVLGDVIVVSLKNIIVILAAPLCTIKCPLIDGFCHTGYQNDCLG